MEHEGEAGRTRLVDSKGRTRLVDEEEHTRLVDGEGLLQQLQRSEELRTEGRSFLEEFRDMELRILFGRRFLSTYLFFFKKLSV